MSAYDPYLALGMEDKMKDVHIKEEVGVKQISPLH